MLEWMRTSVEVRGIQGLMPQSMIIMNHPVLALTKVIHGTCHMTTEGLGITPGNHFGLIQIAEKSEECSQLADWFESQWNALPASETFKESFVQRLQTFAEPKEVSLLYHLTIHNLFKELNDGLDEDKIIKSATGIRNTSVWKKLFKFQRDGVLGGIDKLERLGGCIIADSVGLGKTFEALAIIKYYELRNDRVLVLCPKRLRENWSIYKTNDRRNSLASDRFNYDVLNHTDLSRDNGLSGDIDLSHINWGNYDLVVIDESHNFRNKPSRKSGETRYDRLMRQIIKEGVKTKVLMLSATPVNNRLADLRNQISFVTEGDDFALAEHGINSIEVTVRQAQTQFNRWLTLADEERKPARLMEMLGFDYFKLLDLLTIARSRKHIEKYYGTDEIGKFPVRLRPINLKPDVDLKREFRSIHEINDDIRRMNLSSYAPLRYVLPHRLDAYDKKYSTSIREGQGLFRQLDREESLVHLLRVNMLKRMESSISSFMLTLKRQIEDVQATLARIESNPEFVEELDIDSVDIEDPAFESLLVGRKVKVLLQDVDLVRWKQDLLEDRNRLKALLDSAVNVTPSRDAKLDMLKQMIQQKIQSPINTDNLKIIVFTAFADTATYLYENLVSWALTHLRIHSAMVKGSGVNQTNLPGIRKDMNSILTSFSPRSKERPPEFAVEGEIDLLIATDCISEGQNLQDCDYLVNYDIHWNPVRIIQRFGRIDRIGSQNQRIQLVNFWPNMEIDEYINLEQRVSGRMTLLDISATGEENIIQQDAGNQMNDLEYRREQLLKLQEAVIDLDDLSTGLSIADLTLNDFRIDLATYRKDRCHKLDSLPPGTFAVASPQAELVDDLPPGVIFCLKAMNEKALGPELSKYPLAPHYLVHVGDDGSVLLPFTQAKQVLDRLKKLCHGYDSINHDAVHRFDQATSFGQNMFDIQQQLSAAVASIVGKKEERAVASLFSTGGTHALQGEFAGINDFEVVCYLVVLPPAEPASHPS
jgi:SNF2 family DNA or RNA helicase